MLKRSVRVGLAVTALTVTVTSPVHSQNVDWRLHNLDLAGSRFSELDQITRENVGTLIPRWLFQHGVIDGVSNQTTPVIVDGIMYVTDARGSVYAVDAAAGHLLWTYDVTELLGGARREGYIFRHRGVTYGNGVVYSAAGSFIFALDAKTGEPPEGFGENGQASVILDVLRLRYPDVETAISMGYWFTTAPQIHDGVLYVGSTRSESRIPELMIPLDGNVGFEWPQLLPGDEWIVFTPVPGGQIAIQSLVTGEREVLIENGGLARYLPTGHLAYVQDGTLLAVAFDAEQRTVTGRAVPLVEGVAQAVENGVSQFAYAADGTLAYERGEAGGRSTDSRLGGPQG